MPLPNPAIRSLRQGAQGPVAPAAPRRPDSGLVVYQDTTWLERWLGRPLPAPNVAAAAASPVGPLRIGRLIVHADHGVVAHAVEVQPGLYLVGEVPDYIGGAAGVGFPGADAGSTLGFIGSIADTAVGVIGDLGDWISGFMPKHQQNVIEQEGQRAEIAAQQQRDALALAAEQARLQQKLDFREQRDALRLAAMMAGQITVGPSKRGLVSPQITVGPATKPTLDPSFVAEGDVSRADVQPSPADVNVFPGRGPRWTPPKACCASCAAGRGCEGGAHVHGG